MEEYRIYREILCIDLKSFYASVECALRGLDPFKTKLVVADKSRSNGSVVLAITPKLKAMGVKSRCRVFELPSDDEIIFAKPRMREYLKFSRDIIGIYLKYVSKDDLHIYSVDEAFLDVTHYLNYHKKTSVGLARTILDEVLKETLIPATCGVGSNMLLSKLALDLESKKAVDGIAVWRYEDIAEKLWPLKPLSKMWGIGARMERRLNMLNIYSVEDLAKAPIKSLKREFGVIGEELFYHAHGIDQSVISDPTRYTPTLKSVGLGQTLFADYDAEMVMQILLEMCDEVAEKLRFIQYEAETIHLTMSYSKAYGGGFSRQITLGDASDRAKDILEACLSLFTMHYEDLPIRKVSIRATKLVKRRAFMQVSFFEDVKKKEKERKLFESIDRVKQRFGKKSVARLSSLLEHGTAIKRADMVGGHNA